MTCVDTRAGIDMTSAVADVTLTDVDITGVDVVEEVVDGRGRAIGLT